MLHDCGEAHWQRPSQLTDRGRPLSEPVEHLPAAGIGQRMESPVEIIQTVKHILDYSDE